MFRLLGRRCSIEPLTKTSSSLASSPAFRRSRRSRSCPPPSNDGGKLYARIPAPHVKGANALWPINLVPADSQQIDVVPLNVDRNLAHCLDAIDRKEDSTFFRNLSDFRDGVNHANFIVGVHDGDQNRRRLDGHLQLVQADASVLLHRQ